MVFTMVVQDLLLLAVPILDYYWSSLWDMEVP